METLHLATGHRGWKAGLSAAAMSQRCDLGVSQEARPVARHRGRLSRTRSLQGHWDGGWGPLVLLGCSSDVSSPSRCRGRPLYLEPAPAWEELVSGGRRQQCARQACQSSVPRLAQTPERMCGDHGGNNNMEKWQSLRVIIFPLVVSLQISSHINLPSLVGNYFLKTDGAGFDHPTAPLG